MSTIGIVEGFFGPPWPWSFRKELVRALTSIENSFYIYAPKRDAFLRRRWQEDHPDNERQELASLSRLCRKNSLPFGAGLSPFEIHQNWNESTRQALAEKVRKLEDLDISWLGLFFDDMKGSPDLADRQSEIVSFVEGQSKLRILFCPTYYSDDPILDKVFGERPSDYLNQLGRNLSRDIDIFWCGPKVISDCIEAFHLVEVADVLRRKPFIWDNFYANDGPKQCQFLKLKDLKGRDFEALQASSGWAFNLMNQPWLSLWMFQKSLRALRGQNPGNPKKFSTELESFLRTNQNVLCDVGREHMEQKQKSQLISELALFADPAARDIEHWIEGRYVVGPECLTD